MEGGAGTLTLDSEACVPADNSLWGRKEMSQLPRGQRSPQVDKPSYRPPLCPTSDFQWSTMMPQIPPNTFPKPLALPQQVHNGGSHLFIA